MRKLMTAVAIASMAAVAAPVMANNVTAASAAHLVADGSTQGHYVYAVGTAENQRWYVVQLRAGRSYSFHLLPGGTDNTGANSVFLELDAFQGDGVTALGASSDSQLSPNAFTFATLLEQDFAGGRRHSYTSAVDQVVFLKVHDCCGYLPPATYQYFRVAVTETTLFAPWFFSAGNYDAFAQIQNTSSQTLLGTLTFYSSVAATGGTTTVCGTPQNFSLPAFSSTFFQAKATAGCASGGSAKINSDAPPNTIHANVTSVNTVGTGLTHSFNVSFAPQTDRPGVQGNSNAN